MSSASQALERLRAGNERFVSEMGRNTLSLQTRRAELVGGQAPFAVVLGCSDSRVPVEILFDRGLGDLFVVRVAGNVAAPAEVASIEFAVELLGARLVVVLGHTSCGAVQAALGESGQAPPNLLPILDLIRPALEPLLEQQPRPAGDELLVRAVRENVRLSANHLRRGSQILQDRIRDDGLLVVGAEYSLVTGVVDFFDVP